MTPSNLNIVILAAGQGKRMHSALPKVLHKLAGKPLLQHVLDSAARLDPERVCVIYGHGGEVVPQAFANRAIAWAKQEPQLGTGHAVMQALPHLDSDGVSLILYGDVPLTRAESLGPLLAAARAGNLALLTVALDDPTGYGRIVRDPSGKVTGIVEHKDASEDQRHIREVNTGILALPTKLLAGWLGRLTNTNAQREYYLTDIVAMAVQDGVTVDTRQPGAAWETFGVNSKTQLAELERILQQNIASALLEQGVTLADPARLDVRGELQCGRDVYIDVGCVFEGTVELADGVSVGQYVTLRNAKIAAGSQIAPYSLIEEARVGAHCRIGPYARIRPGTELADHVHIGNFVEVKNSQIAAGSKANHLSYLGDASVGSNCNIGAGTITCNYDGANKHRTIIEDDVFIGSDTQLVAPVTVARGSTIGAGSTITRNTLPGTLGLSRAKQVDVPGWKRPVKKK